MRTPSRQTAAVAALAVAAAGSWAFIALGPTPAPQHSAAWWSEQYQTAWEQLDADQEGIAQGSAAARARCKGDVAAYNALLNDPSGQPWLLPVDAPNSVDANAYCATSR